MNKMMCYTLQSRRQYQRYAFFLKWSNATKVACVNGRQRREDGGLPFNSQPGISHVKAWILENTEGFLEF